LSVPLRRTPGAKIGAAVPPPVRVVANGRKRRSIAHELFVPRLGRAVTYESRLEADLIMLMAVDPEIDDFGSQPETFHFGGLKGRRRYTPDFLVLRRTAFPVYREVKPEAALARDPTFRGRRKAIEAECAARGATFEIWTEGRIRREPRLSNARAILLAPGPGQDRAVRAALMDALPAGGTATTVRRLLASAGLGPRHLNDLLALVATGDLLIKNLDRLIGSGTIIARGRP